MLEQLTSDATIASASALSKNCRNAGLCRRCLRKVSRKSAAMGSRGSSQRCGRVSAPDDRCTGGQLGGLRRHPGRYTTGQQRNNSRWRSGTLHQRSSPPRPGSGPETRSALPVAPHAAPAGPGHVPATGSPFPEEVRRRPNGQPRQVLWHWREGAPAFRHPCSNSATCQGPCHQLALQPGRPRCFLRRHRGCWQRCSPGQLGTAHTRCVTG